MDFDPTSEVWRDFSEHLIGYGYSVLVAWGVQGTLSSRVREFGKHSNRMPEVVHLGIDDARSLATEVLMVSIEAFRTKSLPKWDPQSGAGLATYFIGRCLLDLPDVYVRWRRRERMASEDAEVRTVDDGRHGAFPALEVEARILVDEFFKDDPIVRRAFELRDEGFTIKEIAQKLELSPSGIRARMYRFRRSIITQSD